MGSAFVPALRVCSAIGCHELAAGRFCVRHERTSSRNHGGVPRQARGHGATFERDRRDLIGQPCALRLRGCTGTAESADYSRPGDWTSELQPACLHCQRAQGAALARAAR